MKPLQMFSFHTIWTLTMSFLTLTVGQGSYNLVFELLEEQKANTFIGDVKTSGVLSELTAQYIQNLRYEILGSENIRTSGLFTINSSSGLLYTSAMIDREQVCESGAVPCHLEFDVTVKFDSTVLKILHVTVIIKDINDNAPAFANKELHLSISEASPKGSDYSISGAIDRDAQLDTVITYWLEDNLFFTIREEPLLGESLLKLVLLQNLDREKQSEHHFLIYAKDGNTSSAITGTLSVTITVTDVNDNNPQFTKSAFNFTVSEDAEMDSWVGTIDAFDLDDGENGRISFLFSPLTSNRVRQLFGLDIYTGNITVKSTLEYASGEVFKAVVVAKDHGGSPKASQVILSINVLDAGNTPPKVSLIRAGTMVMNNTVLSEDIPVASFIGRLKYQDNDGEDNGIVDCTSLNHHFTLTPLEASSYAIETKTLLDRERENEMIVILKCSDRGTPSLSTFVNFTVQVSDVNDNNPIFVRSDYSGSVKENELYLQNIIQVSASDQDEGINKDVTYHLAMNTSNYFTVDPLTGWISLTSSVDREIESVIYLTVEAVDRGTPSLTGSVTVTVYVEDVNDNAPEILRTEYQVKENQEADIFVAHISSKDIDYGINAEVTFQMVSDPATSFHVSDTGVITTSKIFDREAVDIYMFVVSVSDMGIPSFTTTSTLTIHITDVNDHSPHILYPRPGNDSLTINANLPPGSIIATASAIDSDVFKNAQLLYLIAEGSPRQMFSIDNSTGAIFLTKRLTTRHDTSYRLTISVQDGGNPRLHSSTFLYITVDFSNATSDNASEINQTYTIISGIIAGITLIVAVTIIAIILHLKRTEPARCSDSAPKLKDVSLASANAKDTCRVSLHQMPTAQVSSTKKQSDHVNDRDHGRDLGASFGSDLFSGSMSVSQRVILSREFLDHQHSDQLCHLTQTRLPQTSEDIHSDTSGEATTSDSGRGTSDVDEISSGVSLNSGESPRKSATPRLPSKRPIHSSVSSSSERLKPAFTRETHSLGDLSRAAMVPTSHKNVDQMPRMLNKVRFSFDDHNVHGPRMGRSQPSYNQRMTSRWQPNSSTGLRNQNASLEEKMKQKQDICHSPYQSRNTTQFQNGAPANINGLGNDTSYSHSSPVSSFLLSKDALLKHNLLHPYSQHQQSNKHSLLLPGPHHHRGTQSVSLHRSVDEDDDNSTTTSGSYAVEGVDDTTNASIHS